MYSDEAQKIKFRMKKTLLSELFDWFDAGDIRFSDEDDYEVTVHIPCSPKSMKIWAKQFANEVTVLSPVSLAKEIEEDLQNALNKYKSTLPPSQL